MDAGKDCMRVGCRWRETRCCERCGAKMESGVTIECNLWSEKRAQQTDLMGLNSSVLLECRHVLSVCVHALGVAGRNKGR
jgi:hypothetical protein